MSKLQQKIDSLSNGLTHLDISHVKDVSEAYNRRLSELLDKNLIIARLYWREPSQSGNLLKPITFKKGVGHDDIDEPQQFVISPAEPDGVLSWSFIREEPLWAENLSKGLTKAQIIEPKSAEKIPRDYLKNQYSPDSMLVYPLKNQGFVIGIYCIDLSESNIATEELYRELISVGTALSKMLVRAHQQQEFSDGASTAVKNFLDDVRLVTLPVELLRKDLRHKRAFFARPFDEKYSGLEKSIAKLMSANGVEAKSAMPGNDKQSVTETIMTQIRNANFGVADITEVNPNVLAEVGMMLMISKPMMLLRSKKAIDPIPFNIAHRYIYEYTYDDTANTLLVYLHGDQKGIPFASSLKEFISSLEDNDEVFRNTPAYKPSISSTTAKRPKVATKK